MIAKNQEEKEIFEINNTCYVVGTEKISTLNNEVYKFPLNKKI